MDGSDAQRQLAEWSELVGGLAHELKNPLSTMHLTLQLLREDWAQEKGPLAARSVQKIDVLLQESRHLENMLADFLKVTSTGELDVTPQDINSILEDVLRFTAPQFRNLNIGLVSQLDRSLPRVQVDSNLFRQVVLNLIRNALEAMESHGGTMTIQTHARPKVAVVDIIDTGTGMSAETLRSAFRPYFSTKQHGTGLGLLMARRTVERHGGVLRCESQLGAGTKLTIELPLTLEGGGADAG